MTVLQTRKAGQADLARVAELFTQLNYPNSEADLAQRWARFAGEGGDCLVAELDGRIVGVLTQQYICPLNTLGPYAMWTAFVVDETVRRSGAGSALAAFAEAEARAHGCTHVELSSSMSRQTAHLFYERHGFQEVRKRYVKAYSPRAVGRM